MPGEETLEQLNTIFREVLNNEAVNLTLESTASDVPEWDSLSNINIAAAAEDRFGIRFRTSELERLANVGDFVALIDHKLAGKNGAGAGDSRVRAGAVGLTPAEVRHEIQSFLIANFLFGQSELGDDVLLLDNVIDSTGVLELVAFLQDRFGIVVADEELIPDNLDSVRNIATYVERKTRARN